MPNSNSFTHHLLFFSREKPLVKSTPPGSLLYYFCLCDLFLLAFIFRSIKPKIQTYFAALYFIRDLFIQSITTFSRLLANFWRCCSKGIDNPFNALGCEYLLFVCMCCSRSVAWFSYWFDNLGLVTKGNTYCSCAASSFLLWGNTDVLQTASSLRSKVIGQARHGLNFGATDSAEYTSCSARLALASSPSLLCGLRRSCLLS